MNPLKLHDLHRRLNASFADVNGQEIVSHYGHPLDEHSAVRDTAGVIDLSFRGRLCLAGTDRRRFLHGQVTNEVNGLKVGEGCYAALTNHKAKMICDLNIHILENEILLDFEPGLSETVAAHLDKYIIADDVQVVRVAPHYGLFSIQGPKAEAAVRQLELGVDLPQEPMGHVKADHHQFGEVYLMNQPRVGTSGFDIFMPVAAAEAVAERLVGAAKATGGRPAGWQALEIARIEAGLPRFGVDMDETNLPPEAGLEAGAISYTKGCYIGQEVIARIRTYGQVAKALRSLRLADDLKQLPVKGDKLFLGDKEAGYITSAVASSALRANIALGYVRREANQIGAELTLRTASGESKATIIAPHRRESAAS